MKVSKETLVPLAAIVIPTWETEVSGRRNVRQNVEALESVTLQRDLAEFGQQVAMDLEKVVIDGKDVYIPIKGHRRAHNLKRLAEKQVIDPRTCKKNPETNEPDLSTGKVFEFGRAYVYTDLTPLERAEMLTDHSQVRGLSKLELFNSFCLLFDVRMGERRIIVKLFDLLIQYYPPTRKIVPINEDDGKDALNYYRGLLQTQKAAWQAPTVLREAYIRKLKGEHGWPTNAELAKYLDIFEKERDKNPAAIDRDNPGPEFVSRWGEYVTKQEKAKADGKARAKADSMMNRQQIEDVNKTTDSVPFRWYNMFIRREVDAAGFPQADKLMKEAWLLLSEEKRLAFMALFPNTETVTPPAKVEEPAKTEEKPADEKAA